MLSSSQIRAARALLGWSGTELAEKSGVGITTLRRYELQKGIPSANTSVLLILKDTLELAGIEFTGDPLVNPGVTLRIKRGD
jgi:transcriptional regulator with XRE-family HTH domain|uniref:helix-turn-helix domain-containing protein n=1 Tax=Algoriphagus sp. TaxID=1872435 RepID=UPI0040470DB8